MRISRIASVGFAAALVLSVAACSTPASDDDTSADSDSRSSSGSGATENDVFPVTIDHVYGSTTIEEKPERIATVAWANHEVPLALDIVPVGFSKATWGDDDDNGVLPWVEDKLTELGVDVSKIGDADAIAAGEVPVLFDETDGIDFEAVADSDPDVILASYSGLTKEDYETLSKIAPVVAYPDVAWGTSVEDMIALNSAAIGLAGSGAELISDLDAEAAASLDEHAALGDAKVLFAFFDETDLSQIGYYTAADTRPGFLLHLGLPAPEIVEENSDTDEFYLSVSAEDADALADVDLIVTYGDASLLPTLQADALLSKTPAIAEGRVAFLANSTPLAASANPSPLSIPWGIDDYFDLLDAPLTAE